MWLDHITSSGLDLDNTSTFALKNKLDLTIQIALGATIQIALLVAPALVLVSALLGHRMDLVIRSPLELAGLLGAALITVSVTRDGETNWLEGAMLLGVYLLLAIAFYFLPDKKAETSLNPSSPSSPMIVVHAARVGPEVHLAT